MKLVTLVLALGIATASFADTAVDPFDGKSCSGALMSANRALELLGPNNSVNLATKDEEAGQDYIKVHYRFRNKINGRKGPWYASQLETHTAAPSVTNTGGTLNFVMYVNPLNRDFTRINCAVKNSFDMNCADSQNRLSNWGNGDFWGVITNNCIRLKSERSSAERDEEWIYYQQIL